MFRSIKIFQIPQKRVHRLPYNLLRSFSEVNQKNKANTTESPKESESVEIDPKLRHVYDELRTQLMVQKEKATKADPSKRELRDSILFEEILRKEVNIPLYDCGGFIFGFHYVGNILLVLFGLALGDYFFNAPHIKDSKRWLYVTPCLLFSIGRVRFYRRFQQNFVESVIYNTQTKDFTITKRNFLFGSRNVQKVPKNELLYTEDEYLNKRQINYINMKTLDLYAIGYKNAWRNKELFSHLIAQRIN